jgi:PadR family transcriptional regulator
MPQTAELLPGTLDLLILHTVELRPLHGVGIADRIEQLTGGVFIVGPDRSSPLFTDWPRRAGSMASGLSWRTGAGLKRTP